LIDEMAAMATQTQKSASLLKIGRVARKLNIAVETIRMYERAGLFLPHKTATGQRLFTQQDVEWIQCIRQMVQELGLNLEGIRRILALVPCWELRPCSQEERENCPAFVGADKPCWMMLSEIPESCRLDCRSCHVYQSASHCTNMKLLIYGGGK